MHILYVGAGVSVYTKLLIKDFNRKLKKKSLIRASEVETHGRNK